MSEFNFTSAICTSRSQSERLLALGLKKETADMKHIPYTGDIVPKDYDDGFGFNDSEYIPAWSLHRLIEILNIQMQTDSRYIYLTEAGFDDYASMYDNIIDCIEWLIKKGYFNKEYLV